MSKKKNPKEDNVLFGAKWQEKEALRKEYFDDQVAYGEFMQKNLFAGKMLKDNGIAIFDTNQANKNFRNLLGLDNIAEIAGVYETLEEGEKVQKIESIRKDNFYNAFHMPIWKNLSVAEKVKSLEWMFETICEKHNIGLKHITYIPTADDKDNFEALYGVFRYSVDDEEYFEPYLFVNINKIEKNGPGLYITTLAHELMHARQYNYRNNLRNLDNLYKLYLEYEFINNYFDKKSLKLDSATRFALYKTCQVEKDAELQGLKYFIKYTKYNREKFGLNVEDKIELENIIDDALFDYGGTKKRGNKTVFDYSDGIVANEEIVLKGQSSNLLKLSLFMNMLSMDIEDYTYAIADYKMLIAGAKAGVFNKEITKEQAKEKIVRYTKDLKTCQAEKTALNQKIKLAKAAFMEILEKGKLPEYFPESNFELIGIKETDNQPQLPKWLEQNKNIDLSMFELVKEEASEENKK